MKNHNYYIKNERQLKEVISYCKATGYASIDFETNGRPFHHPLFLPTMISISFQPGTSYILPLAHKESRFRRMGRWKTLLKLLGKEVIENPDIVKVAWNLKFEMNVLRVYDIQMKGRLFDGMLAKYLLKEERPNDLKSVVAMFIPKYAGYDLKGSPSSKSSQEKIVEFWSNVPLHELGTYCGLDADLTLRLMFFFERLLIKNNFYKLFRNMLMMATHVTAESEYKGIPIDEPFLSGLVVSYKDKIDAIELKLKNHPKIKKFENSLIQERIKKAIFKVEDEIAVLEDELKVAKKAHNQKVINSKTKSIASRNQKISNYISRDFTSKNDLKLLESVNFASPAQMGELFFTSKYGFHFKVIKYTTDKFKRETTNPSTDEEVLEELKQKDSSGFIEQLLEYRGLTKLYSTYIIGMKEKLSVNNYIHASFLLHGTVTGRLSSANPNMQNIPRDTTNADIKKMFIPPPGKVLLQLDYSQAELRVFAAQAKETEMIRWFEEGRDIHLSVACDKNNWDYDWAKAILKKEDKSDPMFTKVKTQRKYAKTINFGIIYGQAAKQLSVGMESSVEEAEQYLKEYNQRFPNVAKFIKKQHARVAKNGYILNVFGRKRRLPNIWLEGKENWGKKAEAQRQSVNAPIQGAASDYTLFSSILIWEKIQRGELPKDMNQCFTVHDSLGFFINPEDVHWVVPILEQICSNPETKEWFGFQIDSVRMQVDFEISHESWKDLKTYHTDIDYKEIVDNYIKRAA